MGRAAYQNHHNISLGHGPKITRVKVSGIGVIDPNNRTRVMVRLPFDEHTIREIAIQNPDVSALKMACRLAAGNRVTGFYRSTTQGISRRPVEFIGLE